jgi:BirA family biotin operon repressor/biotin-[acetyl-CoA-carboxylase] ligase
MPSDTVSESARWDAGRLQRELQPKLSGIVVELLEEVDSSNSELVRRARDGAHAGVLLVAQRQTAGRGRMGRTWHSETVASEPGAALTFSLGLPLAPLEWSGMSLAVGLAVARSLHAQVGLKWPNDLWYRDRKMAGILIETVSRGDLRYAVIGVGINVGPLDNRQLNAAVANLRELEPQAQAPALLERLAPELVAAVRHFAAQGFSSLRGEFHARDVLYGREVTCSDGVAGIARGVDAAGALLVHTQTGIIRVSSAEVSIRPASPLMITPH